MKQFLKLLPVFTLFLFSCTEETCTEEKKENPVFALPPYTFEIKASTFGKAKLNGDTVNVLFLETTLNNNTNDTLKFGSMSCSWSDIYVISNTRFSADVTVCDKNTPVVLSVIPQTNAKTFFNVILGKIEKGSKEKLKVGLKLIPVKSNTDLNFIPEKIRSFPASEVMWSNEIEL